MNRLPKIWVIVCTQGRSRDLTQLLETLLNQTYPPLEVIVVDDSLSGLVKEVETFLIEPCNVEELKQAILLLYNDPDLRAKLGRRAKERSKLYDVDRVYGQILRVYKELVRYKAE